MSTTLSASPRPAADPMRVVLLLVALYLGAFWAWSGVAKAFLPTAAYEFAAQVVGGGIPAKAVVVVSVVLETALGLALLAGVIGRRAGIAVSLGLLLAFSGLLAAAKASGGGALACGCYAFFATGTSTVDSELWINGSHAAVLAAVLAVHTFLGRRSAA
jgi:hypothetical protein